MRGRLERFAGLQVFTDADVPCIRPDILVRGSALDVETAGGVEQKDVDRAMPEPRAVHVAPRDQAERQAVRIVRLEKFGDRQRKSQGRMTISVPSCTAFQIASIASFGTAIQPSVQSSQASCAFTGSLGSP